MHSASEKSISASSSISSPKTIFIVGAGASKEVGLPIGSELKESIAKVLDIRFESGIRMVSGDDTIFRALNATAQSTGSSSSPDINSFLHACRRIRDAMPQAGSIDSYIDTHSGDKQIELCGKLAIIRTILEAEATNATNSLFVDQLKGEQQLKYDRLEKTWFNSFFRLLTNNCKRSDLANRLNSVAFVIFNYDRCIEHYLYYALQNYYHMDAPEVAQILRDHLEVYHPYGAVGSLPWLNPHGAIGYGGTPSPEQLLKLASQIKTFTEGTDTLSSQVGSIRSHMKMSHRLIFLGFAFHEQNMDLLTPSSERAEPPAGRRVFATGHGLSMSSAEYIDAMLIARGVRPGGLSLIHPSIKSRFKCNELFHEYERSMSFE
ncbi:MAG: hypothetical protein AABY81_01105 [Pseudomonadota bacterium]